MRELAAAETRRAETAESERDHWRQHADALQSLLRQRRRGLLGWLKSAEPASRRAMCVDVRVYWRTWQQVHVRLQWPIAGFWRSGRNCLVAVTRKPLTGWAYRFDTTVAGKKNCATPIRLMIAR